MHKGITADGDDSVPHGRKRILALLVDSAVLFGVVIKPVVFNICSRFLQICIHKELFASREIFCGGGDLHLVIGLNSLNTKSTFAFGQRKHHDKGRFHGRAASIAYTLNSLSGKGQTIASGNGIKELL